MVSRWSEKSAGLKILWVWTFGTAAILITSVVRTRLNDMDKILRQQEEEEEHQAAAQLSPHSQSQFFPTDTILKEDD